uniref:Transthyretin n=1 Tax=Lates calcarifer TaxID=8187 RepID=A0A4W6C5Z2_LATCA
MSAHRLQQLKGHILPEIKSTAMAGSLSPLTTHVLNTSMGVPGSNMALSLYRQDLPTNAWSLITTGTTNDDGRCPGLITKELFTSGVYKIRFESAQYWASIGQTSFYPYVEVRKGFCFDILKSSPAISCLNLYPHLTSHMHMTLNHAYIVDLFHACFVADCLHYK